MIRISTNQLYANSLNGILDQQKKIAQYNREISTGTSITSPADAPVAAARVVNINAALGTIAGWTDGAQTAQDRLAYENTQLQGVQTLIGRVRTLALQMSNATVSAQDRENGAATAKSYLSQLIGYANAQGPDGNYVFGGSRTATQPFAIDSSGANVSYRGDGGQQYLSVSASNKVAVSDPGGNLFMDGKNGNGTFQIDAASSNTGTATAAGSVTQASTADSYLLGQGDSYRISFSAGSSGLDYKVERGTGPVGSAGWNSTVSTVASGGYKDGSAVNFDGMSLSFSGVPAAGDGFSVSASSRQSLFATIQDLYQTLQSPATTPAGNAQAMQRMGGVLRALDLAQTRFGSAQAVVGSRIQDAQAAANTSQSVQTQLQNTRSGLQSVDLPSVITKLDQASLSLQAASKAFASLRDMSLFNYI